MLKVGVKQGVGIGRECRHSCQFRCQILHVWVLFPPGPALCNHCSVTYAYWKGWLCFQEISLNWGHQNLKRRWWEGQFQMKPAKVLWFEKAVWETTLPEIRWPEHTGPKTRTSVGLIARSSWELPELCFPGSRLDFVKELKVLFCIEHVSCLWKPSQMYQIVTIPAPETQSCGLRSCCQRQEHLLLAFSNRV